MTSSVSNDATLIPPTEMLFDGSSSSGEFVALGENFCRNLLLGRARLAPTSAFLDVGCGNGGVARALTGILSSEGRYEGLDIHATGVAWLKTHYAAFPNFQFTYADVYNKMYNAAGKFAPRDYRFPYPDSSFDLVLLKSVFTHMLPDDLHAYIRECSRVLAPGGRAVMTFFLLNDESARFAQGTPKLRLDAMWEGDPRCRVANVDVPEVATGHDEARVRQACADAGLAIGEIAYGDWCGRPTLLGLQDLVIAIKA